MVMRRNTDYWEESLNNRESVADNYYYFDNIIVSDETLIRNVERLRELVISYCVLLERGAVAAAAEQLLDEIYEIIMSNNKIPYTEFVAFWKTLDMSYSVFKKAPDRKLILKELLKKYCERRRQLYDRLGYSNVTVQALYDNGSSRSKGVASIAKLIDLVNTIFGEAIHCRELNNLMSVPISYCFPDRGDKILFDALRSHFNIGYRFGEEHQGKYPDMALKVNERYFIIEAKHIKESGGAQNKQILETIEFIKYAEDLEYVHYLSFMDGIYFNNYIWDMPNTNTVVSIQRTNIERYLNENRNNFYVNTAGLKSLLIDLGES